MTQHNINKRAYVKPAMKVYPLIGSSRLLAGSEKVPLGPGDTPNQW